MAVVEHRVDGLLQFFKNEVFQQIAIDSGCQGLFDDFLAIDAGEDEDFGCLVELTDRFGCFNTRGAWHGDVENGDVGFEAAGFVDGLCAIGALGDHFVVGQGFKQGVYASPGKQLVVSEKYSDFFHAGRRISQSDNFLQLSCRKSCIDCIFFDEVQVLRGLS